MFVMHNSQIFVYVCVVQQEDPSYLGLCVCTAKWEDLDVLVLCVCIAQ